MNKHRHRWLSKWLMGFCGTGIMLQRYGHQTHSNCPRCGIPGESVEHIIQCQEKGAKDLWTSSIKQLETWMLVQQGHPELVSIVCTNLINWQLMRQITPIPPSEDTLHLAYTQQQRIGWLNFIQGFVSRQWRNCQAEYFTQIKSRKSAVLWMSRVQQRIWSIVWDMWKHRNELLHGAGDRIHITSLQDIDADIRSEWERGLDTLPLPYASLFSGSINRSLKLSFQDKQQWLTSVWSAQDTHNRGIQIYDRTSNIHYNKWRAKKRPITLPTLDITHTGTSRTHNLSINTQPQIEGEASLSDDDSIPGLGSTPQASYDYTTDKQEIITVIPQPQPEHVPLKSHHATHTTTSDAS
jgi:hypothetical protein